MFLSKKTRHQLVYMFHSRICTSASISLLHFLYHY